LITENGIKIKKKTEPISKVSIFFLIKLTRFLDIKDSSHQ